MDAETVETTPATKRARKARILSSRVGKGGNDGKALGWEAARRDGEGSIYMRLRLRNVER